MNKKNIFRAVAAVAVVLPMMTSCNDFLDELPDNRTTIDSKSKIISILTEAYPSYGYLLLNEFMSDNTDCFIKNNSNTSRFAEQVFNWEDITESDNEDPEHVYSGCYSAIANANQALEGFNSVAGWEQDEELRNAYGEALLCRAYAHFLLACEFCMPYGEHAADYLGMPYIKELETELDPKHDRGTLEELYANIKTDLEEGLKYVGEKHLSVPKYHFNEKAAYAFATRFYLYHMEWDKAITYATKCLGSNPTAVLRDYKDVANLAWERETRTLHYIDESLDCNLMLQTSLGVDGMIFSYPYYYTKFSHGKNLSLHETVEAHNVWCKPELYSDFRNHFYDRPGWYQGNDFDLMTIFRVPYLFEYTDPVAGIGYPHYVYAAFTTDECLLNRAEAYILTGNNAAAVADMNTWMQNALRNVDEQTVSSITEFYNNVKYAYSDSLNSTIKKHLNPDFTIGAEGSEQECLLQCVLQLRRIETLFTGIRWWDVKRYGIEIPRRIINLSREVESVTDWLKKDDQRRAIQLPQKVLDAGMEPNPRQ